MTLLQFFLKSTYQNRSSKKKEKCTSSVGISEDLDSDVDNSLASGFGLVGALLPPNEKW